MAQTCDGCGGIAIRLTYRADGLAARRWLCPDCGSGRKKMTRLARVVLFRWTVARVLAPNDPITVPVVRLMMAVDDVRRAQILFVEASERIETPKRSERHRAIGDYFYSLRLLFSHLHEAGYALRQLDGVARNEKGENRVNLLLAGNREAMRSLKALRKFFGASDYKASLPARIRNAIGFHYDKRAVATLLKCELSDETLLDSTAASVGGLARMADSIVRAVMNRLIGGDFLTEEPHTREVSIALAISGHLITFVDHLFDALIASCMDSVVGRCEELIDVPPLVARAAEAVDAAKRRGNFGPRGTTRPVRR